MSRSKLNNHKENLNGSRATVLQQESRSSSARGHPYQYAGAEVQGSRTQASKLNASYSAINASLETNPMKMFDHSQSTSYRAVSGGR